VSRLLALTLLLGQLVLPASYDAPTGPPRRPTGLGRFLFRLPLWLYRARLGALLGRRFVLIHHIGRVSGRTRQVVVEVVEHDAATGSVIVASGFGPTADWYRNLLAHPQVSIQVGARALAVRAVPLDEVEAGEAMVRYARRHRVAARGLGRFMGFEADGTEAGYRDIGRRIPMLRLETLRGG
jgi:deazaflavin-dependent oxidoreductase (nitroreductase family)